MNWKLIWAYIRCWWHCAMVWNIIKGHCMFTGERDGKVVLVSAVTGSIWNDTIKQEVIYYHIKEISQNEDATNS